MAGAGEIGSGWGGSAGALAEADRTLYAPPGFAIASTSGDCTDLVVPVIDTLADTRVRRSFGELSEMSWLEGVSPPMRTSSALWRWLWHRAHRSH